MKKIFTYSGIFLSVVLMGIFSSCKTKEIDQPGDLGLNIKVFSPTKVVPGQPMTINGSGFGDVKEIVFPSAVSVTDFEIVSNEMIRVTAPAGISAEGGKLIVRTDKDQVESPLPITIGSTSISGYSKQEGEEVEGGSQLTVFGKDLEFIYAVKLLNADGLPNIITHEDFYRKGTSSVVITIPKTDIYEGSFKGVVYTYDGKSFEMPEFVYKPGGGGHWQKVKTIFWENKDGDPIPGWGGKFRFGLEGTDGNNECIATFPAEQWAIIKDGLVRASVALTDASNIRITTGWWSAAYGGTDHNCTDFVQEDEDGNTFIELNIKEEGTLYDLIDQQHLLFTGDAYTLLSIYTEEEIWVPGEEGHWEIQSYWKNTDGTPIPSWGGTFRFANEQTKTGEEIHAFTMDEWATIKEGTVRVAVAVSDASNIRITTGWWSAAYGGTDHNCVDMVQVDEEDGTTYIELNIKGEGSLYDLIDQQHLLFTGSDYTLLEIYNKVWVEGGGGSKKPTVIWENDGTPIPSWGGTFRFGLDGNDGNNECIATFPADVWSIIKDGKVRASVALTDASNIRITTGWWSGAYGGTDHNCVDMVQEEEDGTKYIELDIKGEGSLYDLIDQQHLLFTGDAYTLLKLYYYQ